MIYSFYRKIKPDLEHGFHFETNQPLNEIDRAKVKAVLAFDPRDIDLKPYFDDDQVVEIGPKVTIETPMSSNAVSIFNNMGMSSIIRVERTRRHLIELGMHAEDILKANQDRMTEQHFPYGFMDFTVNKVRERERIIDVMGLGKVALEKLDRELGLGFDAADLAFYTNYFVRDLQRNPRLPEILEIANSNSEHSRHGYFRGTQIIDGVLMERTLFDLVRLPLAMRNKNNPDDPSLVAFHDNAGVIRGFVVPVLIPVHPGRPSEMKLVHKLVHITQTAETHCFPTLVAPFPGAQTGAGGRIRDGRAVGRGGKLGIAAAGYFISNIFLVGYDIAGEVTGRYKLSEYATAHEILRKGSDGISSYGNEIGEPLALGFCRSFEQMVGVGDKATWMGARKPVLYSAGSGNIYDEHIKKEAPETDMWIVAIGGPAYPIGVNGGSASSTDKNSKQNDENAVQRGNAEMGNKANRVIQTCIDMEQNNPISSIHDQGAGGPGNVLPELIEPLGGRIDISKIVLGDKTMSVAHIWVAEFQERYGLLIRGERLDEFRAICARERVNCEVLGQVGDDGKVVVFDSRDGVVHVELDLKKILTELPQKEFSMTREVRELPPLALPEATIAEDLKKVLQQLGVGSKGHLVHKVDRSVTGLVGQQQCCGIAQIPISDYGIAAQSYYGSTGAASSLGENPLYMLIDSGAGSRMAVGEAMTNLAGSRPTKRQHITCRSNWMWPAKLPGEGARLYDAVKAKSDIMIKLGIAANGGKDSLSMHTKVCGEVVKTPGTLVVFATAPVEDITAKITPDIKKPGQSTLMLIDLGHGKDRLGGSALAQAHNQLGNECPDMDDPEEFARVWDTIQEMIDLDLILSIHDRSDGGLITAVTEMCMASRCGFRLQVSSHISVRGELFSQELGYVLEIDADKYPNVRRFCEEKRLPIRHAGFTLAVPNCLLMDKDYNIKFSETIQTLRSWWEATSYELEKRQMNPVCAKQEYESHVHDWPTSDLCPSYKLTYEPRITASDVLLAHNKPRVAVFREEGSNGECELTASCKLAGLEPFDVCMEDLLKGEATLDDFQGLFFPGGFSYADVLGSAVGWSAIVERNQTLKAMFDRFRDRKNTISAGFCNGCQFMANIGWVPWTNIQAHKQPRFTHNLSGRFDSRWCQVEVLDSPAVLLKGMVGSRLPVWLAHGEGRLDCPDPALMTRIRELCLAPLALIDPWGKPTETYPFNPNGSPLGVTSLCSIDGRHLAMMPHPERVACQLWQSPWLPHSWQKLESAPWLRLFQNAYEWCMEHPNP